MKQRQHRRILLVDNDPDYRKSLIGLLELDDFIVEQAGSPEEAFEKLEMPFDLALVDIRLRDHMDTNDISGMEVAKRASEQGIPCIIVTAFPSVELAQIALRSRGAEPYAEDMITKASGPQALLASINVTLNYIVQNAETTPFPDIVIDTEKKLVRKRGKLIDLSKNQYILLIELFRKNGGLCTHAELIKAIYDETVTDADAVNDRRLRNLVDRTKEKIEDSDQDSGSGSGHEYIEAVTGRGYRLNLDP